MIAYIHFVSGINMKKKLKVPVGDIKKFDSSNVKPRKLYEVKCGESYERALIIHVAETEESLNALIEAKRAVIPPQSQLLSPSDSSFDESSQLRGYHVKPRNKMSSVKKKENLPQLLEQKMKDLKSSQISNAKTSDPTKKVVHAHDTQFHHDRQMTKSKPRVLTIAKVHDETECSRNVKSLVEKNKSLCAKVADLETRVKDQNLMVKDITQLNMELQRCVISHFDELQATVTQMASANAGQLGNAGNFPPVGYVRKVDKMMHLRRGEWLPKNIYDSAVINAKNSSSTFSRNLCSSVFGHEVLLQSTLTGCGSNRKKEGKRQYPKLDENKLLAIHDTFRFWALTDRQPPLSEVKALLELSRVNAHISQKIADLKRAVRNHRPAAQKTRNENRPNKTIHEVNQESDPGSEIVTDSDSKRVRDAEKVIEKESKNEMRRIKKRNTRDEPQQSLNKDRSDRTKHQKNQEEDTGSDIVMDSDSEGVTIRGEVMEQKINNEVRSKKNQNWKDKPQPTLNEDRSNRTKHTDNQKYDTGLDTVMDSKGKKLRGAERVLEKKTNYEEERKEEKAQESGENTEEIEPELHQGESDNGSTTTDMFEDDISDTEYPDILTDNEHLYENKHNEVDQNTTPKKTKTKHNRTPNP